MIKILATSDWHLGNAAFGIDRKDEFCHFMSWLFDVIKMRQPDALLVAGDVFDNSNPSSESQRLYYDFLTRLYRECNGMKTVIIAGNHDSAGRLEAPRELLGVMNVEVRGYISQSDGKPVYDDLILPVTNKEGTETAWVMAVPYLRDGDFERLEDGYSNNVKGFFHKMVDVAQGKRHDGDPLILLAHLYARNADITKNGDQSERIVIGGAEQIDISDLGGDIDLTILGHIHKRQTVDGVANMRYIGSALPMSFSEKYYVHGTEMFTFSDGILDRDAILFDEYSPLHRLITIPDDISRGMEKDQLLSQIATLADEQTGREPLLKVAVNLTKPDVSLQNDIQRALVGKNIQLCAIQVYYPQRQYEENAPTLVSFDDIKKNPMDMLKKIFKSNTNGCEMEEGLERLAQQAIDAVNENYQTKEED